MESPKDILDFLTTSSRTVCRNNFHYTRTLTFIHYTHLRLRRFRKFHFEIKPIHDQVFKLIIQKYCEDKKIIIDPLSCVLLNGHWINPAKGYFANICCSDSTNKYRVRFLEFNTDEQDCDVIYIAETTLHNVEKTLNCADYSKFFILPAPTNLGIEFASAIRVSPVSTTHECPTRLIDTSLKNYFTNIKYLRKNDLIVIDLKKYALALYHTLPMPELRYLYFRVDSVEIDGVKSRRPAFVSTHWSTLTQEKKIHSYLPKSIKTEINFNIDNWSFEDILRRGCDDSYPIFLRKYLEELEASITPFMNSNNWMGLKPVYLVQGPAGSGKHQLITALCRKLGFNLLVVNLRDLQTFAPPQIEVKIRLAFGSAKACCPCIVKLSNIDKLGKDTQGNIDERVTSNFSQQIADLYEKKLQFPVIVIATTESNDIPADISADMHRNFIDIIKIDRMAQTERIEFIEWFLRARNVESSCDLSNIAQMCDKFRLGDMEALSQQAIQRQYIKEMKEKTQKIDKNVLKLEEDNFLEAHKSLKIMFTMELGTPRIPKVYWEDIGGMADLKRQIMERIELPSLHKSQMGSGGILLYGPPGTGKTLLAKAIATECELNFLTVKGPELLNMYVGQSEKNVRDVFEKARKASPCIIFFDELDAMAPSRGQSGDSGGVMDRVVSTLLAEMGGLGTTGQIFVIGATNRPDLIDAAILRPGRFDKLLYVGMYADKESQLSVVKAITRRYHFESDGLVNEFIKKLPKTLSGADIRGVCSKAWDKAVERIIGKYERGECERPQGHVIVTVEDLDDALREFKPSVKEDELENYEKIHQQFMQRQRELVR